MPQIARSRRFPLMDGMRAAAALAVFGYHVGFEAGTNQYSRPFGLVTSYLDVGVSVFFAISGFLLYRQFLVARRTRRPRRLTSYARSRALRIVPAYWVALTLASIYPTLVGPFTHKWWLFYGFLQDYSVQSVNGLPQAWSLSVEVTFYVALPIFALAMATINRGEHWLLGEVVVLVSLAVASAIAQLHISLYTIIGTFDWFAVGMLLAALSVWAAEGRELPGMVSFLARRPLLCWSLAAASYVTTCAINPGHLGVNASYTIKSAGDALTTGLLMIPVTLSAAQGAPARLLGNRLIAWLGTISYGIFLYHLPVLLAMRRLGLQHALESRLLSYTVIGLAATVALAAASWYLIERPLLALKSRPREPSTAVAEQPVADRLAADVAP